ncbi:hypothetical protein, partial [Bacteroides salyersiae]|uniref:hypothetical protein n=1 Tax=Bacteroides salyersiae TaxID=291644 RepID=UPI00196129B4
MAQPIGTLAYWHIDKLSNPWRSQLAHWHIGTLANYPTHSAANWHIGTLAYWQIIQPIAQPIGT